MMDVELWTTGDIRAVAVSVRVVVLPFGCGGFLVGDALGRIHVLECCRR